MDVIQMVASTQDVFCPTLFLIAVVVTVTCHAGLDNFYHIMCELQHGSQFLVSDCVIHRSLHIQGLTS